MSHAGTRPSDGSRCNQNCVLTRCIIVRYSWRAMSNVPTLFASYAAAHRAQAVAIATITTTTGTIGAGVRTRVQD